MQRRQYPAAGRFADRWQAGRMLGKALEPLVADVAARDQIVLGLPRGGVVVAAEVAAQLQARLDAIVVRKIGSPAQPELAIGAVGPGGVRVFNRALVADLGIAEPALSDMTIAVERLREQLDHDLREGRPPSDLTGKLAILVDDGLATGASMRAALTFAQLYAASVIVAVPTAAPEVVAAFETQGIRIQSLITPAGFESVGFWYDQFIEVSSEEVKALLGEASSPVG